MERLSVLYATALFELALEQNAVGEFYEQAILIRETLSADDVNRVLVHPQIPVKDKHELFKAAFGGKIRDSLLGFLFLAAEKNREAYILPALSQLVGDIDRYNNKVTANVITAVPYDKEQAESLKTMLSNKLDKDVELDMKVDPSVIGGPFIYADGYYVDWTVKKRLRDMTRSMKEGCSA